ncbi:MAG: hypothetical protein KJ044_16760 [Planctomycetes bacterium]|nr:hypothetical protein [Planctomycetota bacterium]
MFARARRCVLAPGAFGGFGLAPGGIFGIAGGGAFAFGMLTGQNDQEGT